MKLNYIFFNKKNSNILLVSSLLVIWLAVIILGMYYLLGYEYTPGKEDKSPTTWPADNKLSLGKKAFTLVMLLHPECSCSKASLGELSKLAAKFSSSLDTKIIVVSQSYKNQELGVNANLKLAKEIPEAEVLEDNDGSLARSFNASTSGFTLLYGRSGNLLFNGGITAGRGHWGDNLGSDAISNIIKTNHSEYNSTRVFGCDIFGSKKTIKGIYGYSVAGNF